MMAKISAIKSAIATPIASPIVQINMTYFPDVVAMPCPTGKMLVASVGI